MQVASNIVRSNTMRPCLDFRSHMTNDATSTRNSVKVTYKNKSIIVYGSLLFILFINFRKF